MKDEYMKNAVILTCLLLAFLSVIFTPLVKSTEVAAKNEVDKKTNKPKPSIGFIPCFQDYTDLGNGTVKDNCSNLVWQKTTSDVHVDALSAQNYCSALSLAGLSGWRVPTMNELTSLIDYSQRNPTTNPVFEFNPGAIVGNLILWSSTPNINISNRVWSVDFANADTGSSMMTEIVDVRCVRTL